jgi:hypothetical protein
MKYTQSPHSNLIELSHSIDVCKDWLSLILHHLFTCHENDSIILQHLISFSFSFGQRRLLSSFVAINNTDKKATISSGLSFAYEERMCNKFDLLRCRIWVADGSLGILQSTHVCTVVWVFSLQTYCSTGLGPAFGLGRIVPSLWTRESIKTRRHFNVRIWFNQTLDEHAIFTLTEARILRSLMIKASLISLLSMLLHQDMICQQDVIVHIRRQLLRNVENVSSFKSDFVDHWS